MKVIDPGHVYDLAWLDGEPGLCEDGDAYNQMHEERLIFVKREGEGYTGNVGHHPGTNMQEVIRALIDRLKYLHAQIPAIENLTVLQGLRDALWALEKRAAKRHQREFIYGSSGIELLPTCTKCGHIGCVGECHP